MSKEWETSISIFQDRINNRYFYPINMIIERDGKSIGEGFAILTLQCSIIEFLATLEDGMIYRYEADKNKGYYYSKSAKWYNKFLNSADIFEGYFFGAGSFLKANDFYKDVRCALIHEARTRKDWTINIYKKNKALDKKNSILFEGNKIYRTALNNALKQYFDEFCEASRQEDKRGMKYRRYIGRKLDVIEELEPDKLYWW